MPLLGAAALAMSWDIAPAVRADFEHWHSHEHFPERLGIPGFLRATRWGCAAGGEGFFVTYELRDFGVLSSPAYLARLNAPTPWSTRLMPEHRNMVRSQCRVLASAGGAVARHALVLRFSPAGEGEGEGVFAALAEGTARWAGAPGLAGAHLLRHEAPPIDSATTEQKIRGGADRAGDGVLVVTGCDLAALQSLSAGELSDAALGVAAQRALYTLSHSAVPGDVAPA